MLASSSNSKNELWTEIIGRFTLRTLFFMQLEIDDTTSLFILTRSTMLYPLSWSSSSASSSLNKKRLIYCEIYLPICIHFFASFRQEDVNASQSETKRRKKKAFVSNAKSRHDESELWMELIDLHNGKITAQVSNCYRFKITILPTLKAPHAMHSIISLKI